ncbi:MAG TPA: glycosyltransferase family 39 protein [Vicinamibacterales bacterium]|jgi:4-amino-4-deoxy-L-arabinose transferase-like glycosyltransferase
MSIAERHQRVTAALALGLAFAAVKIGVEFFGNLVAQHAGYGIFRDELYYIVCGRHLAWGYVDQAPLVAVQARLATALFGFHDLALFRLTAAVAGGIKILLTGLLVWGLGGRRPAQILAMVAVLIAPVYLGIDSYLSMNAFEPVFWMGALLAVMLMVRGASPRWWLVVGLCGGLGILNKPSAVFFLAALVIGLLITPQRRLLWSRWVLVAGGLMALLVLPYGLWQLQHHWPTLEWLNNVRQSQKNVVLAPLPFVGAQILMLHPLSIFLLLPGLVWLFAARDARRFLWIGVAYLVFLALMMHLHAKDYYLAPIYPVLFAAGALAWEHAFAGSRRTRWLLPAWCVVLAIAGALTLPMAIPVLAPQAWIRYTRALHLNSTNTETQGSGPLPQFFADRFGWSAMVARVAQVYDSLSPVDREKAAIYGSNYGEAAAVDVLGAAYGLPHAISGHQNYFFWGPRGYTGEVMIVIDSDDSLAKLQQEFSSAIVAARTHDPLAMPYENRSIFLCRGLKRPLAAVWPTTKNWM